jgi:hypothetical protein
MNDISIKTVDIMHRRIARRQPVLTLVTELDICGECGATVCDCIPPATMAALLERIDADPHGVNDLSGLSIPF